MKYSLLVFVLLSVTTTSHGQKNGNFLKLHSSAEFTSGLFNEGYNTGWGIYATDYFGLADKTAISLSTGIASWDAQDESMTIGMFFSKLGLRQFLGNAFYFHGDAGIAVGLKDWSGSTKFAYSAGFGYLIRINARGGIDISTKVNRSFGRTWIGLGAGYEFKL